MKEILENDKSMTTTLNFVHETMNQCRSRLNDQTALMNITDLIF